MDISIIIVNWNSVAYLRKCLNTIYDQQQDVSFEVIVLDGASFDGCAEMLLKEFPQVIFIQSQENLGFARGNNEAAARASGEALLFLNPDTELKHSALKRLNEALNNLPNAGAVGAMLLNSDGTLQTSCIQSFPTIANQVLDSEILRYYFPRSTLWGMAPLFSSCEEPAKVAGISGACLMTRREAFLKVGGFSLDYFMYYEDMDYCLKLERAGWNRYYVHDAVVIHHGGKSSGGTYSKFSTVMTVEAASRFLRKKSGRCQALLYRLLIGCSAVLRVLFLAILNGFTRRKEKKAQRKDSVRKWLSITRWSIGQERWISKYYTQIPRS
jgi:GT2 family glycosyltransferase